MENKIRVLHTEWSDGWGGQEIRTINEMIALREKGMEVFLACREHAQIKIQAVKNGIKVFTLPFKGTADLKTMFALKKIIKENDIDIVNTHSGKDTWVGGFAAKLSGAKFIRTRHLSNRIRSSRLNFINEIADYIFTTGESVKDDMIKYNRIKPERIMSIPTGIDETVYDPEKFDKVKSRQEFGISDDEIAIGIVAVLRSFKRHDIFIKSAKELINMFPNKKLKFIIAGDGPKKDMAISLIDELDIKENVVMLGHVSEVPKLLSALDIFVLSSDSKEGVPQSVMQALLMELPAVATDVGSTKDLYNGKNFKLVKPNDIDMLSKNIAQFIQSEELSKEYSSNARKYIVENFSKSVMVDKILNAYKEVL